MQKPGHSDSLLNTYFLSQNNSTFNFNRVNSINLLFLVLQYSLPLQLINNTLMTQWMEILRIIMDRDVPAVRVHHITELSKQRLSGLILSTPPHPNSSFPEGVNKVLIIIIIIINQCNNINNNNKCTFITVTLKIFETELHKHISPSQIIQKVIFFN